MANERVVVGDEVFSDDYGLGVVRFIGPTLFSEGTMYGVELRRKRGKNNGTYRNHQYFECRAKHGIFVKRYKISIRKRRECERISIDDAVTLPKRGKGYVRFVGPTRFGDGVWYGVELEAPKGKSDGSVKKVRYFKCKKPHGIFMQEEKLHALVRGDAVVPHGVSPPASPVPDLTADGSRASLEGFPRRPSLPKTKSNSVEAYETSGSFTTSNITSGGDSPEMMAVEEEKAVQPTKSNPKAVALMESDTSDAGKGADVGPENLVLQVTSPRGSNQPMSPPGANATPSSPEHRDKPSPRRKREPKSPTSKKHLKNQSSTGSQIAAKRDRAHTFPTIAVATDNSKKIKQNAPLNHSFKVLVIGPSRVGKTSLVRRFVHGSYSTRYRRTVGFQEYEHHCEVPIELREESLADANMIESFPSMQPQHTQKNSSVTQLPLSLGLIREMNGEEDDGMSDESTEEEFDLDGGPTVRRKPTPPSEAPLSDKALSPPVPQAKSTGASTSSSVEDGGHIDLSGKGRHSASVDQRMSGEIPVEPEERFVSRASSVKSTVEYVEDGRIQIKKTNMLLQFELKIVDVGFHAQDESLYENINAMVLVCDLTKPSTLEDLLFRYQDLLNKIPELSRPIHKGYQPEEKEQAESGFIPLVVAANKCDVEGRKLDRHAVRRFVRTRIRPLLDEQLEKRGISLNDVGNSSGSDDETPAPAGGEAGEGGSGIRRSGSGVDTSSLFAGGKPAGHVPNQTLLAPPLMQIVYEDDSDEEQDDALSPGVRAGKRRKVKRNRSAKGLLKKGLGFAAEDPDDEDEEDDYDSAGTQDRNDLTEDAFHISVVECSAKSGKNIEKVFEKCVHKTLPSKLTKMAHKRTRTTALVTAPIWLRNIVAELGDGSEVSSRRSSDDAFELLDDAGDVVEPMFPGMFLHHDKV